MGIITGVLVASGYQQTFHVPTWVILSAHAAIALGTLSGGWRIVHTMGGRLTRLKPRSGFCAETGAAAAVLVHHGSQDQRLVAGWPAYEEALKAAKVRYEGYVYEGAQHGFHNDTTPRYDEKNAKLAWERTLAHFNKYLR